LPREIGIHPESGKPITTSFGRFGPFVQHDGKFATLESAEEVFSVGINRAVDLLAQKSARGARARPGALKDLGAHPDGGGNVQIMSGRYGAYVKHGAINATLPSDKTPETLTLEEAVALLAARAAKGATKKSARAKPAKPAKRGAKAPAAKTPAKRPAKRVRKPKAAAAADA
jgi:DNA topoisomerase-1